MHLYQLQTLMDIGEVLKNSHDNASDQVEGKPECLKEDLHQISDHPNTIMNTTKAKTVARMAANDERRQVLSPRVI
jgi:hypothetical protein